MNSYKKNIIILTIALITSSSLLVFFSKKNKEKPNIIWISIDTLRAKSLKAYNYSKETAPTISNIANEGIVFEQVIAQGPVTQISHFSMLTGTYPFKHKILSIDPNNRLPTNILIASEYFKNEGYQTILSGAFNNNPALNPDFGLKRGVDAFFPNDPFENLAQRITVLNSITNLASSSNSIFAFFHTTMVHGPYLPSAECLDPNATKYLGKMIWDKKHLQEMFKNYKRPENFPVDQEWGFGNLYFHLVDINKPTDLKQLENLYDGAIRCMDNQLRDFLSSLYKVLPHPDNTILILKADHGESLGEHHKIQHGNMFEENLKVPLIIHFPKFHPQRTKTPVRSIDILPTILDYVGITSPSYIDGKSLLPLLNHPDQDEHFDYAFSHHRNSYAVYHKQYKYIFNQGDEELYDLRQDPNEQKNLIDSHPEIAFQLENEYFKYAVAKKKE